MEGRYGGGEVTFIIISTVKTKNKTEKTNMGDQETLIKNEETKVKEEQSYWKLRNE